MNPKNYFHLKFTRNNLQSSLVVFLVALPLCLGIALASGAPASSGIIAGIVGGLFVGLFSPSQLSVAGPAAGLAVVVASGITQVGSFEIFCAITLVSGIFQCLLGFFKLGTIGNYIPTSVIKGLLSAIGILIVVKQIPHVLGVDSDFFGEDSFFQLDGQNTFSELFKAVTEVNFGAFLISCACLIIYFAWPFLEKRSKIIKVFPSALIMVTIGILINEFLLPHFGLKLSQEHLVQVPTTNLFQPISVVEIFKDFKLDYLILAGTLCLIGSIETLLSLEASEKLDPKKKLVNSSQELVVQGFGNMISGFLGGLPITSVIVRSSANISLGADNRSSGILHGLWLGLFVLLLPQLLNVIPLSTLAMILIFIGYKLAPIKLFKKQYKEGRVQFIPFIVTVVAILFTNILVGVMIGTAVGLYFVIKSNLTSSVVLVNDGRDYLLRFNKDTSFLNKAMIRVAIASIPDNSNVIIDGSRSVFIDHDIIESIEDFIAASGDRSIRVDLKKSSLALCPFFKESATNA